MNLRAFGYRTDLSLLRFDGIILERGNYWVIRTPTNPLAGLCSRKTNSPKSLSSVNRIRSSAYARLRMTSAFAPRIVSIPLRRLRTQCIRAAQGTDYYRPLFAQWGLDPAHLTYPEFTRLPITPKEALRESKLGWPPVIARPISG